MPASPTPDPRASAVDGGPGQVGAAEPSASALRHRDYAVFWTAALISNSASWMQQVAVPFVLFDLTGSHAWVGVAAFSSMLPSALLTPLAGVLADRVSRRLILFCTQCAQALIAFAYLLTWTTGSLRPGVIVGLQLASGISAGFQVAAWQSFIPLLVPRAALLDAVRLNSVQFTAARAIGPLTGAGLLGVFGISVAFLLNGVTFALVLLAIVAVRPRTVVVSDRGAPWLVVLREGFRYVRDRDPLRQAVITGFAIAFFGQSLISVAAGLAADEYGVGEQGLGVLIGALGVGAVLTSFGLVTVGDRVPRSRLVSAALVVYIGGAAVLAAVPSYAGGLIGYAITGAAHVTVAVGLNTSVQLQVDERLRGRVMSIYVLGILTGIPIGSLLQGVLAETIGLRSALALNAVGFAVFGAVALARYRGFVGLDADEALPASRGTPPGDASTAAAPR